MTRFGITARFPLGVFQGHYRGRGEPIPSPSRLHSALIAAAAKGSRSVEREGDLRASAESVHALEWLESHPPGGITVPLTCSVRGHGSVISYRAEGVMDAAKGSMQPRVVPKGISDGLAVSGSFGWVWDDVPEDIAMVLKDLCEDVPVLGETDSPVILEAVVVEPNLVLDSQAGELSSRGHPISTPIAGRFAALESAYDEANPAKRPSPAQDAFSQTQFPSPSPVVTGAQTELRYVARDWAPPALPWTEALLFPTDRVILEHDRVRWCVTLHRAIAKLGRDELPSAITGKYPSGVSRPANRVAIQYAPGEFLRRWTQASGAFLVLLPAGMSDADKGVLTALLSRKLSLYSGGEQLRTHLALRIAADEVWDDPRPGTSRWWHPAPAIVAEARRQTRGVVAEHWSLRDAACLSLGYVFRDQLTSPPRDYHAVVAEVLSKAVRVEGACLIADSRVGRYAHKLPDGLVAQPFSAVINLGDLADDRAIIAIGQSRHLGGGLLLPVDRPLERQEGMS